MRTALVGVLICGLSIASVRGAGGQGQRGDQASSIAERLSVALKQGASTRQIGSIATDVLTNDQHSAQPEVLALACFSTATAAPHCSPPLRAIADNDKLAIPLRLRAAGALLVRGEDKAAERFDALAAQAPIDQVFQSIETIEQVPGSSAVPALVRLLESDNERAAVAAARALGSFHTAPSIEALKAAVASRAQGTAVWLAANAAQARLGLPEGLQIAGATHPYLPPEDLLAAASGFLAVGDPRGESFLLLVTRKADGIVRLRAAALLRARLGSPFRSLLTEALAGGDSGLRAEALVVARETAEPLPPDAAGLLLDAVPAVRVRAAEFFIAQVQPGSVK